MSFGTAKVEFLVVGLGNPGAGYDLTRHNIGFRALDYLAGACQTEVKRLKHQALTGRAEIGGHGVLLMKPQTYMNRSGEAVADAARFYKISPERVVILHDDISLAVGAMRIRTSGSAGGHNGLKSVQEYLSSDRYMRVKLGVGERAHREMDLGDHVLGKLTPAEFAAISENFKVLPSVLELLLDGQFELAMSRYNRSAPREKTE